MGYGKENEGLELILLIQSEFRFKKYFQEKRLPRGRVVLASASFRQISPVNF